MMKGSLAFIGWTVASFICHLSAKTFLRTAANYTPVVNGIFCAALVTASQTVMCLLLTKVEFGGPSWVSKVKVVTHLAATMATNYSMTLIDASSTFAIKLFEPVTSAIVQRLVLKTKLNTSIFLSLPTIVGGAIMFCGSTVNTSALSLGGIMALVSNVMLGFRNVAIKLESEDGTKQMMKFRGRGTLVIVSASIGIFLGLYSYMYTLSNTWVTLWSALILTSVFHVLYSFISTNIVLRYMSVLSHSIANIMKRVLVVSLLFSVGQREATLINFLGLGVCTLGLLAYTLSQYSLGSFGNKIDMPLGLRKWSLLMVSMFCSIITVGVVYISSEKMYPFGIDINVSDLMKNNSFQKERDLFQLKNEVNISFFLRRRLINTPTETDIISPLLTTTFDVIKEVQRVQINLFSDVFSKFEYAMLFDVAAFENKGDPAITVGEAYLIRRLGLKLVYYCNFYACKEKNLNHAKTLSAKYSPENMVIMFHGGGNIVGYPQNDRLRANVFKRFPNFQKVLFSQSIYLKNKTKNIEFCKKIYNNDTNFTMIVRDKLSLRYAQEYFSGRNKIMMAPDMAFQIGHVDRFLSPSFDVLWVKRSDGESPGYKMPIFPKGITVHVADWWKWKTPHGETTMETAFLMANNGLVFLQRGRVVVTDRLHGHILSVLLDIPHVLIDNAYKKLSSFHNTWTKGLENTLMANNAEHAVELAVQLLEKYNDTLPSIVPFMDIKEKA